MVLVLSILISLIVVAVARLVTADLAFSHVAESRSERRAAALGGLDYALERARLNQTLCATGAETVGWVDPAVIDLGDNTVTVACDHISTQGSPIAGWSLILTDAGGPSTRLTTFGAGAKQISGTAFAPGTNVISASANVDHIDGDLVYSSATCPGAGGLATGYHFLPEAARGPLCASASWDQIAPAPPLDTTIPVVDNPAFTTIGGCRVFSPGRYTTQPNMSGAPAVYFRSGVYWFDNLRFVTDNTVWFGHPGTIVPEISNPDCELARDLDPNVGGTGAVIYLSDDGRLRIGGNVEFFGRRIGGYDVSVQTLESGGDPFGYGTSTLTPGSNPVARLYFGSTAVYHGLLYAPRAWFAANEDFGTLKTSGGLVTARVELGRLTNTSIIGPVTMPTLVQTVITATATDDRGTTTVEAVVDYRPDLPADGRVAVNSTRIVDQ